MRFDGCSFTRNAGNGLYIHRGTGGSVFGATVVDSLVEGNGNGIVVADTDQVTIARNRVVGHNGPARSGIAVGRGTRHGISDNELLGNRRGILTADASGGRHPGQHRRGHRAPTPRAARARETTATASSAAGPDRRHRRLRRGRQPRARCAGAGILTLLVTKVRVAGNIVEQTGQSGILTRYTSYSELERQRDLGHRPGGSPSLRRDRPAAVLRRERRHPQRAAARLDRATRGVGVSANSRGNRVFANVVLP